MRGWASIWSSGIIVIAVCVARATDRPTTAPSLPTGTLVCVGGSFTAGEGAPTPDQSYVGRLRARAAAEGVDLKVVNEGRSGWSTGAFVANTAGVVAKMPADATWVTILLGTNDARSTDPADAIGRQAAANLERLIAAYHAKAPRAQFVIVTPTSVDVGKLTPRLLKAGYGSRTPANLRQVTEASRVLAGRLGLRLIDLTAFPSAGHTVDGVHPDAVGHAEVAAAIWSGLSTPPPTTEPTTRP